MSKTKASDKKGKVGASKRYALMPSTRKGGERDESLE